MSPGVVARAVAVVLLSSAVGACSEPALPESAPETDGAEDVLTDDVLDPTRDELVAAITVLTETVTAARDDLDTAATSEDPGAARAAVTSALARLLDGAGDRGSPGLFPSLTSERSGAGGAQDDLLTATLAVARESGGSLGRAAVETLRDPIAGDLGAWERDAEGVVATVEAVADGVVDVDAAGPEVMELPADGVRALAWTMVAEATTDPDLRRSAAERGSGHLSVVLVSLGLLDGSGARP